MRATSRPRLRAELERKAYLQLTNRHFKVPGWMLSSGTLRVLVLLTTLRHPRPPPLVIVEKIENGLAPPAASICWWKKFELPCWPE